MSSTDPDEESFESKAELIRQVCVDETREELGYEDEIWAEAEAAILELDVIGRLEDAQRAIHLCVLFLQPGISTSEFDDLFFACLGCLRDCGKHLAHPSVKADVFTLARCLRNCFYLFPLAAGAKKPLHNNLPDPTAYLCVGVEVFENAPDQLCFLWQNAAGQRFATHERLDELLRRTNWESLRDRFGYEAVAAKHPDRIRLFYDDIVQMFGFQLDQNRPWREQDREVFTTASTQNAQPVSYTDAPHVYTWVLERLVARYRTLFPEIKLHTLPWNQCKTVTWLPGQDPFDTQTSSLYNLIGYMARTFDQHVEAYQDERKVAVLMATHPRVGAASAMRALGAGRTALSDWNVMREILENVGDFKTQRQLEQDAQDPAAARRSQHAKKKKKKAYAQKRGPEAVEWQELEAKRSST
jgi:hypothetical protein